MISLDEATTLQLLEFSNSMADGARQIALQYFQQPKKQWMKSDNTFVTEVDLEIETHIRNQVSLHYPDHGFFGEEFGDEAESTNLKWCVDPIDGTEPFVFGLPTFGILISLTLEARPVIGVLDSPALKERWSGAKGFTTTWQGRTCRTNQNSHLQDAIVFATTIDMFNHQEKPIFDAVTRLAKRRRFGADCYAYGLLANGNINVVMEADMKPYDMMALVPVVEGAGGMITDWRGEPLTLHSGRQVLATANQKLHEQCLTEIAKLI